MEFELRLTCT